MTAIFKREWKAYFQTVVGWLFIAVTLSLFGLYFYVYNMLYGSSDITQPLSAIIFIFLITVPVLTMRSIAEDRRNKTDQMILTAPVSVGRIVVAKYLATAAVFTCCIAVICLAPLILSFFGTVAYAQSYVAVLGFWLYGLLCIAIGTFISSLTESVVISAVVTFAALFLGYMMSSITGMISQTGNLFTKLLSCYDLTVHMDKLMSGILDISGVVYYLSMTALFLFLTAQSVQKRRWSITVHKLKMGAFSSVMVAAGIGLTVVVNLVTEAVPVRFTSFDMTAQKFYSITDETKKLLKDLDEDITVYVLAAKSAADETLKTTLERYEGENSHISVEYKDPSVYPNFYLNYTDDTSLTQNSLIVESTKRAKVINYSNVYETSIDYSTYQSQTTGYDGEGQLTSAIAYVTSGDMPVVYELTGHGESALSGNFKDAAEKANITLNRMNLLEQDAVPEDAKAVIINGPTSDLSEDDAEKLIDYINQGGRLFVSTMYTDADMAHFKSVLSQFEVSIADGMVLEADSSAYYQNPLYLLPAIESDALTDSVDGYVFVPYAQGLTYNTESDEITYTPLLTTSDSAFSKADVNNMTTSEKEEGDTDGPFSLGLKAEKSADDKIAELIVFSSTIMLSDDADAQVSGNNLALFGNILTGYADTNQQSIVIPVKSYDTSRLTVSTTVILMAEICGIVVIPVCLLVIGIVIWARRRKR